MFMGDEQQYPSEPDVGGSGDSRNLRLEAKDKGTARGVGTWASPPGHPPQDFLWCRRSELQHPERWVLDGQAQSVSIKPYRGGLLPTLQIHVKINTKAPDMQAAL